MTTENLSEQNVKTGHNLKNMKDLTEHLAPGNFVTYTLIEDTKTYFVEKVTPKTVTLRPTREVKNIAYKDDSCDNSPGNGAGYSVVWYPVEPDPEAETCVRRLTKEGVIRPRGLNFRTFYIPLTVNGQPVARRDWRA